MLWAVLALLAGVMTACSEDDEMTPEEQHKAQLTAQVKGEWLLDLDGSEYDIAFMGLQLSEQQKSSAINFWIFDVETTDYVKFSVPLSYEIIRRAADDVLRLEIDTAKFYAQYPEVRGELGDTFDELIVKSVDADSLRIVDTENRGNGVTAFSKGTFDPAKVDKQELSQILKDVQAKMEEENASGDVTDFESTLTPDDMAPMMQPDGQQAKAARRAKVSFSLNSWMSKIDDNELVANLCIPSAHDCTTYGIKPLMTAFGVSQAVDLKTQFDRGVRVFDLRVRNGLGILTPNSCYHDCLNCNKRLTSALDDIVSKVTASGSQEGAIVWISPERNQMFGWYTSEAVVLIADFLASLKFDPTDVHKYFCIKQAIDEVKEHVYDKGCLATFTHDMKMKDLRRKVLVMFDYDPEEVGTFDWGVLGDKVIIKHGNFIRPDGKEFTDIHSQNEWGPGKEGNEAFMANKKKVFLGLINGYAKNRDNTWIFNACNAYVTDPLPNYSEYAAKTYPYFTKCLNTYKTRGIFQTDYCGVNKFTRVNMKQLIGVILGSWTVKIFGLSEAAANLFYWIAYKVKSADNVNSDILIRSMINNNFKEFEQP